MIGHELSNIMRVVCLVVGMIGFSNVGSSIFSGFCRAIGAVFFILAFITRVIEMAEAEK